MQYHCLMIIILTECMKGKSRSDIHDKVDNAIGICRVESRETCFFSIMLPHHLNFKIKHLLQQFFIDNLHLLYS